VSLVVDTSVVVKWVVEEPGSGRAQTLVGRPLVAPDLLRAELANALCKKVVIRKELTESQAARGLARASAALRLVPAAPLADRALTIALRMTHPVYDCFFLALAEELEMRLITADERLLRRLRDSKVAIEALHVEDWNPDD